MPLKVKKKMKIISRKISSKYFLNHSPKLISVIKWITTFMPKIKQKKTTIIIKVNKNKHNIIRMIFWKNFFNLSL